MAGTFTIDMDGNITIMGNLAVSGNMSVGGVLGISTLRPLDTDITIDLEKVASGSSGFGNLTVRGVDHKPVVTIDASGSAHFAGDVASSGSGTFTKLNISSSEHKTGTQSGEIANTQSTIGTGALPANSTTVTISTTAVTDTSLIYVTPITSTNNQVLYIENKQAGNGFTVNVDHAIGHDITFNWWIIN